VYIDDSGDEHTRCFSALLIHESVWKQVQNEVKSFRRELKRSDGMFVTKELHATEFVAGRGRIASGQISKYRRSRIFLDTLAMIAALPKIQMINAVSSRANERYVFERLINRINRAMHEWKSNALIIHDEGKDYTYLVRRMSVYNPIRSRFGAWPDGKEIKNMPVDRILEDIVFHDSRQSIFIQMADFCAYALFRSEVPLATREKYGINAAFSRLEPICIRRAFSKDPRKLGIIRYP